MELLPPGHHFLEPTVLLHVYEGARPGPTALVQAAIHGDEPAGALALEALVEAGIDLDAGRLLVVPVMNPAALRARRRAAPGGLDLNRVFPGDPEAPEPERRRAARFMALVRAERPALVLTLHESRKRLDPEVRPSFGQSVVYGVEPMPPVVGRLIGRLNAAFDRPEERFAPLHYPVPTSSTEVIVEAVGCVGLCFETWMALPLARRVAMHAEAVRVLLDEFGLRGDRPWPAGAPPR